MLGHQDEIASSYRRSCTDLKERLKIGLDEIYNSYNDGCQGKIPSDAERNMDEVFDPLVNFEKKLLKYVMIKQEFQAENKNLRMKLKELQLSLQAKNKCISKLKEDIVSHFIQIEFLRKHNEKLEVDLDTTRKKLNQFERSEEWLEKQLVFIYKDTENKPEFSSDGINRPLQKRENIGESQRKMYCKYSYNKNTGDGHETYDGLKKFHVKLIKVCHENIFLKEALEKMKNINKREDRLKELLRSSYDNSTVMNSEDEQKKVQINQSKENKEEETNKEIVQLNDIIDSMRVTVLQLQFEKRNMELTVFKMREYFLKMRGMQRKLRLMLRNENIFTSTVEKSSQFDSSMRIEEDTQELTRMVRKLKLDKLQMEMEHQEELSSFTDTVGEIQYILRDIKAVCDDISDDSEQKMTEFAFMTKKDISRKNEGSGNKSQSSRNQSRNDSEIVEILGENSTHEEGSKISPPLITTNSLHPSDFNENCCQRYKSSVSRDIHRRMKLVEEQYKRIVLVCSKNMDLLKEVDNDSLVSLVGELRVLVSAKEKILIGEKLRFEKYKRFLLNSVRSYRKSYKLKEKQYEALRNLHIPIARELKRMKTFLSKNGYRILNSEENDDFTKVIQMIEHFTDRIQTHIKSSGHNIGSDTSEILFNYCDNIVTPSKEDEIEEEQTNNRTIGNSYLDENQKLSLCILSEHLVENGNKFEGTSQSVICPREHSDISDSVIEQLRRENSILQTALTQRDHLLGKIFNTFKSKIEGVAEEITEKYFLQRLCNDLKSTIKIYECQNKIFKEALENNNICTRTIYIQRTLRRNSANISEDYIRELLKQQRESCEIKETFSNIQSRLEFMKNDLSLLQNVVIKR